MNIIEKKSINRIKRSADQITSATDISKTNNDLLDISKKIFFEHIKTEYKNLNLSLYHTRTFNHHIYPNITVTPHFVRDDGVIIYLKMYQDGLAIQSVSKAVVHLTMEILKIKSAIVYIIELTGNIKPNNLHKMSNKQLRAAAESITPTTVKYSRKIVKEYLSSLVRKKIRLDDETDDDIDMVENTSKTAKKTNNIKGFIPTSWVSASKTRNYALNDTLIDWLEQYGGKNINNFVPRKTPAFKNKMSHNTDIDTSIIKDTDSTNFSVFIMNKGIQFEAKVIQLIKASIEIDEFVTICFNMKNFYSRVQEYEASTIKEIKRGTPFIYQPVLLNRSGILSYSYGIPDLLVRSDYLCRIVDVDPMPESVSAPKLGRVKYHYVIVDIKFTTLDLCSDGLRIRNTGNFPAYKCQLYIYNHALGQIQGYEPGTAYILGRKCRYESAGTIYSSNNCFSRLGHIQYDSWDNFYIDEAVASVRWIKNLRANGSKWKLYPNPSVEELYPNMCVNSDGPWNTFKEEYAANIGEITQLWNCGVGNRLVAHANGIYSYKDANCTAEKLGINGQIRAPVVNSIIQINRPKKKFKSNLDKLHINLNPTVDNSWLDMEQNLRIAIDFEIINNIVDDFKQLPEAMNTSYLFMVGVSYVSNNKTSYKMFLLSELSTYAELQLIIQVYKFLRNLTDKFVGSKEEIPLLYHWGQIEQAVFASTCKKIKQISGSDTRKEIKLINRKLNFYDLSNCFQKNPIVINGCFKFGIKEIAKKLFNLNLIKTTWQKNNICSHGNAAMILAYKAYKESEKTNMPIIKIPVIKDIMAYNKIDCLVLHDIVDLLVKKAEKQGLL